MIRFVELVTPESTISLPAYSGAVGPPVIDVTELSKHGIFTYDPGFLSTAACTSEITYVDGQKGLLLYRGYPIEQLAQYNQFLEVVYLLIKGELPSENEAKVFTEIIGREGKIDTILFEVLKGFRCDAHPMAMMMGLLSALAGLHKGVFNREQVEVNTQTAISLVAKMPVLAAMCYRHSRGEECLNWEEGPAGYVEGFLYKVLGESNKAWTNVRVIHALDRIFTLHADHEQNASTSTLRLVASTGVSLYACLVSAVAGLWGPMHGGANEACLNMLKEIGDKSRIDQYIKRAKDPNDPFRLMGFGHRVYKSRDPRAAIMRQICYDVLEEMESNDSSALFRIARTLEKIALEDEYFVERKLYPNVDFYSGIILYALGMPANMFTVIFALARTAGWVVHWLECISDPNYRLYRPRQFYRGPTKKDHPVFIKQKANIED